MVNAEFTASSTKPLPTHNPWSGGSNSAPKFVFSLSRLLTPLKFASSPEVVVSTDVAVVPATFTCVPACRVGCTRRTPLGYDAPGASDKLAPGIVAMAAGFKVPFVTVVYTDDAGDAPDAWA